VHYLTSACSAQSGEGVVLTHRQALPNAYRQLPADERRSHGVPAHPNLLAGLRAESHRNATCAWRVVW